MSPERRRRAVRICKAVSGSPSGGRAGCSQHRSSQRYWRRLVPDEALLRERLRLLARRHPRYGYRRIHALLRREGWACNRKRVQRLWRDEGLRLPAKTSGAGEGSGCPATSPPPARTRCGRSTSSSTGPPTAGRSRSSPSPTSTPAKRSPPRQPAGSAPTTPSACSSRSSSGAARTRPHPLRQRPRAHRRSTQRLVPLQRHQHRLHRARSTLAEPVHRVIQRPPPPRTPRPGKSFNTLYEAQLLLDDWRLEYNHYRPHQSLNYQTPAAYAHQWRTDNQPDPHNKWTKKRGQVTSACSR